MCRFESEGFGMVSSLMSAFPNPERGGERDRDLKDIFLSRKSYLWTLKNTLQQDIAYRRCGVFENGVCFQNENFQYSTAHE